jgi:hypothetical protein
VASFAGELWSSPVAALWTGDDVQVARLEDRLILTPQARRRAGIVPADDPRRAGSGRHASRPPSARERERLLRG